MSIATRTSIPIVGDGFKIYCDIDSSVEVMSYISGQIKQLDVSYIQNDSGFKVATITASADGYYFVRSGRNVQSLKKGNAEYKLFIFDGLKRDNLDLCPESYDEGGTKIGDNQWEYIGFGIYSITPLVDTPFIIKIFGMFFYCFPNANLIKHEDITKAATSVSIGVKNRSTMITIGGTSADLSMKDAKVGLKVGQTIFKV